jgi:hypothetical protein
MSCTNPSRLIATQAKTIASAWYLRSRERSSSKPSSPAMSSTQSSRIFAPFS